MKKILQKTIVLLLLLVVYIVSEQILPQEAPSSTWQAAHVIRTIDGDTILVEVNNQEERVRMIGIDTPESVHPSGRIEDFGLEASAFTDESLTGKTIYLESDKEEKDRYGRRLSYIWLKIPKEKPPLDKDFEQYLFNGILVQKGYAQELAYGQNLKYEKRLKDYEKLAIQEERGMWAQDSSYTQTYSQKIKGNRKSKIYHLPQDPDYQRISEENTVYFESQAQAKLAGYRRSMKK